MPLPNEPFYYIRHGQTDWNKTQKLMGQNDIPLNETGLRQAHKVVNLLEQIDIKMIVTSPLIRAKMTAEIISNAKLIPIKVIDELQEACWGHLEGQPITDTCLESWYQGKGIEGAEPYIDFKSRVQQGLQKALDVAGPVLIVGHGIFYDQLLTLLNLPPHDLDNCIPVYHSPPTQAINRWLAHPL